MNMPAKPLHSRTLPLPTPAAVNYAPTVVELHGELTNRVVSILDQARACARRSPEIPHKPCDELSELDQVGVGQAVEHPMAVIKQTPTQPTDLRQLIDAARQRIAEVFSDENMLHIPCTELSWSHLRFLGPKDGSDRQASVPPSRQRRLSIIPFPMPSEALKPPPVPNPLPALVNQLRKLIQSPRRQALRAVDSIQVRTCWEIGRYIVEFEQQGQDRAVYGRRLIPKLAETLTAEFGRGFDTSNLRCMRLFYQAFPKCDALRHELSWTHYRALLRVESETARQMHFPVSNHVVCHQATVTRARRKAQNGHRGAIIWFSGLSGSGKSTLAHAVEESLHQRGCRTFVLDGDLGFPSEDRQENIRCTSKTPSHRRKPVSRSLISMDSGFRRNDESGAFRSTRRGIGEMANCAGLIEGGA